jgi:hypothetical protein
MPGSGAWPIRVDHAAEMRTALGEELSDQVPPDETMLSILWVPMDPKAPREGTMWRRTRGDQVLAITERRLLSGATAAGVGESRWVAVPYEHVLSWAITVSLLYGRLDVYGHDGERSVTAAFEFNTVGLSLVEGALAPLERTTLGQARGRRAGWPRLPDVGHVPVKFSSLLARALLPTEEVCAMHFEPAVVRRVWGFRRLIRPAQLLAATDLRTVLIRDEKQVKPGYGYCQLTVPCRWAKDFELVETDGTLALVLRSLPSAFRVEAHTDHRRELERALAAISARGR